MDSGDIISERLKNYIIFTYIKEFVSDLHDIYKDNALSAYKNFMEEANVLTEANLFVDSFKEALSGKHRAKYTQGAYVNIPKFLSYKDPYNNKIIKKYLEVLDKLYKECHNCKELVFFKKNYKSLSKNFQEQSNNCTKNTDNVEDIKSEENLKKIIESFKPEIQKSKEEFYEQQLNLDRILKIFLIDLYDKICNMNLFEEDSEHIKNLISIFVNNPIDKLASKKLEIMKEIVSIKNISKIPYQNILNIGGLNQNDINQLI